MRVCSLSCSSCSLDGLMALPHLVLCHRGVALKLLDRLGWNEVLGLEAADADGKENETDHQHRAADDQGGPIGGHPAALQPGDRCFEQYDQCRHYQDRTADPET